MILSISGRADICAFYTDWLMNRMQAGYVDVRNPFYPKQVSRIMFEDVEGIIFCTKNPIPILSYLHDIKIPYLFHITLTPYGKEIEVSVHHKKEIIQAIQKISNTIGADKTFVRYDPIFLNEKYTIDYHVLMFTRLCQQLEGYVQTIIISFLDLKKNTQKHQERYGWYSLSEYEVMQIAKRLVEVANHYGMKIQTCSEPYDLSEYGIQNESCVSKQMVQRILPHQKTFKKGHLREHCHCVQTVDIGVYNSCSHLCRYCYANYDEKQVLLHSKQHDPKASVLIGQLQENDIIKIRK